MQFLTPKQYRVWKKISRQDFHQKAKRGTIPTVKRKTTRDEVFVPVEDTELAGVNIDSLTA